MVNYHSFTKNLGRIKIPRWSVNNTMCTQIIGESKRVLGIRAPLLVQLFSFYAVFAKKLAKIIGLSVPQLLGVGAPIWGILDQALQMCLNSLVSWQLCHVETHVSWDMTSTILISSNVHFGMHTRSR